MKSIIIQGLCLGREKLCENIQVSSSNMHVNFFCVCLFVSFTTEPNPWKLSISFLRPQGSQFCFSPPLLFHTNAIGYIKSLTN